LLKKKLNVAQLDKMNKFYRTASNWYVIAITIISLFAATDAVSQDAIIESALPLSIEWSSGSIMTNGGSELKGLLKYNDKNGILSFQNGGDTRAFTARNVAGFEFFDEGMKKQRIFYSFPYEDSQNNIKRPLFFEVIKEFESFAVLSKVDPLEIDHNSVASPAGIDPGTLAVARGQSWGTITELSQTETIYFMDSKTVIRPYVQIIEKEVDGLFYDISKTKNKMIDDDLLEEFIGANNNKKLASYAKENKLSFKRKSDLIKILGYYSELVN